MKTIERRIKRVDLLEGRQTLTDEEKKRTTRATGSALELAVFTPELQAVREQLDVMARKFAEALPAGVVPDDMDGQLLAPSVSQHSDTVGFEMRFYVRGEKKPA